jgi:type II secretion system protein H
MPESYTPSRIDTRYCRSNGAEGFTLVELMVVMVILGIAAALVVPQIAHSQTFSVQAAARAVVSDLMYAQNDAIAQQTSRKVIFDVAGNHYRLTDSNDLTIAAPWMGGSYQLNFTTDSRFRGVSIDSVAFNDQAWVLFDDLGTPNSGGSIDLVAGTSRYRISVSAFTGRITVAQADSGG